MIRHFSNRPHVLKGTPQAPCDCAKRDVWPGTCMICDGGLSFCVVCRGGEADLPTMCPGRIMTTAEMAAVQGSEFDWVKPGDPIALQAVRASALEEAARKCDELVAFGDAAGPSESGTAKAWARAAESLAAAIRGLMYVGTLKGYDA